MNSESWQWIWTSSNMPCANCNLAGPLRAQVFITINLLLPGVSLLTTLSNFESRHLHFKRPQMKPQRSGFTVIVGDREKKGPQSSGRSCYPRLALVSMGLGQNVTVQFRWMITPGTWIIRKYLVIFQCLTLSLHKERQILNQRTLI